MAGSTANPSEVDARAAAAWQARRLLRAARVASLATVSQGQPFVALVTPASAPDLSVLLWLSSLSEHTRQLRNEPRCALLVSGTAEGANPQTAPRLSITGLAEPVADAALKARWLSVHPYAALYADFADFSLWRIRPLGGNMVGGFARATRLRQADLAPDPDAVAAVAAAEAGIVSQCNADHADGMALLARAAGGAAGAWRMVSVDVDGIDLAWGESVLRLAFGAPVANAQEVRQELERMTAAAISPSSSGTQPPLATRHPGG